MSTSPILQKLIAKAQRTDLPPFHAGDTVRVHVKIKEGDKERLQHHPYSRRAGGKARNRGDCFAHAGSPEGGPEQ